MNQLRTGYQFTPGYRLQSFLGRGQFGEVWKAAGPGGVGLALKFISLADEAGLGQKEYAAIQRVKQIQHANLMLIAGIWRLDHHGEVIEDEPELDVDSTELFTGNLSAVADVESTSGPIPSTLVVAMPLASRSLESFLPSSGQSSSVSDPSFTANPAAKSWGVPPDDLIKYFEGIARGLDFLNSPVHDFGGPPVSLQHCDIKPANLVLIADSAVICDFGLARILNRNQATATGPAGTPAYMSPETIEGKPSRTSDQYSLAVTYYHLRTGTLPLQGNTLTQIFKAHALGELNFDLVEVKEANILRRATALDWQQRYETNSQLVGELRDAIANPDRATDRSIRSTAVASSAQDQSGFLSDFQTNLFPGSAVDLPQRAEQTSASDAPPAADPASQPSLAAASPKLAGHRRRLRRGSWIVLASCLLLASALTGVVIRMQTSPTKDNLVTQGTAKTTRPGSLAAAGNPVIARPVNPDTSGVEISTTQSPLKPTNPVPNVSRAKPTLQSIGQSFVTDPTGALAAYLNLIEDDQSLAKVHPRNSCRSPRRHRRSPPPEPAGNLLDLWV